MNNTENNNLDKPQDDKGIVIIKFGEKVSIEIRKLTETNIIKLARLFFGTIVFIVLVWLFVNLLNHL